MVAHVVLEQGIPIVEPWGDVGLPPPKKTMGLGKNGDTGTQGMFAW